MMDWTETVTRQVCWEYSGDLGYFLYESEARFFVVGNLTDGFTAEFIPPHRHMIYGPGVLSDWSKREMWNDLFRRQIAESETDVANEFAEAHADRMAE
jgi:hypothetical protein